MIISEHAPNPFDLCVDDAMYAVADMQGPNKEMNTLWHDCIYIVHSDRMIAKYPKFKIPHHSKYFNTGFMLFRNTDALRNTFDLIDQNREFEAPTCYDQSVINMIVANTMKVTMLPETWNYIVWGRPENPEAYINHFAHAGPSLE